MNLGDWLRAVDAFVFGTVQYRCVSRYGLHDSLARLSSIINTKTSLGLHFRFGIVGKVGPEGVEAFMQRSWHSGVKPVFRGAMKDSGEHHELAGAFSMFPSTKWTIVVWTSLWVAIGLFGWATGEIPWFFVFIGPGFMSLMIIVGRLLGIRDVRAISDAMDIALTT